MQSSGVKSLLYTVQTLEQPLMFLLFIPETEEVCWKCSINNINPHVAFASQQSGCVHTGGRGGGLITSARLALNYDPAELD